MTFVFTFYCAFCFACWATIIVYSAEIVPLSICSESFTIRECDRQNKAYSAIKSLHTRLDKNKDGGIDFKETNGYLSEDLAQTVPSERVQKLYESDNHINPNELWDVWTQNDAYLWTVQDVKKWLIDVVDLPQVVEAFMHNAVDGKSLPLLIDESGDFILNTLGVSSPIYREKLALKALEVILFGVPKHLGSIWLVSFLLSIILLFTGTLAFSYTQQKKSKSQMKRMEQELDALNAVVRYMRDIREQSEEIESNRDLIYSKSQLQLTAGEKSNSVDEMNELEKLRSELSQSRKEIIYLKRQLQNVPNGAAPPSPLLCTWLQITFEVETNYSKEKKLRAENFVKETQDNHNKLRKKASSIWGTLKSSHDASFEKIHSDIEKARSSLDAVKQDLDERAQRWAEIQRLLDVKLLPSPGLQVLRKQVRNMTSFEPKMRKRESTASLMGPASVETSADEDSSGETNTRSSSTLHDSPRYSHVYDANSIMHRNNSQALFLLE
ncbi:hypothetical protein Ciccas_003532 [Cichlidogyrus casuarinus]|uniref:SAM domain-containing protein n=1 Tax=Cichlidogyrus casuarinus TaxID=1844966 RepID=A0ABD2QE23_9PLAT